MAEKRVRYDPDALRKRHNRELIVENAELRELNLRLRENIQRLRELQQARREEWHEKGVALHELLRDLLQDLADIKLQRDRLQEELADLRKNRE